MNKEKENKKYVVESSKLYFNYEGKLSWLDFADIREWCKIHYPNECIEGYSDTDLIGLIQKYEGKVTWLVRKYPYDDTKLSVTSSSKFSSTSNRTS
ncbi:MAG: hypothetical protein HFE98_06810 [Ruminiclostridium sp.]|nr:hypothetical protein [Ruminiclostridium sp.]